jgi:hypothetical protein
MAPYFSKVNRMQSVKREQGATENDVQETVTLTDAQLDWVVGTGVGTSGSGHTASVVVVKGVGTSGSG